MGYFHEKRTGDPKWVAGDEEHDAALAESGVAVEAASRIRAQAPRWLVQDVVPDEAVTIIGGEAGAGKTFFACRLAADVARQLGGRVVLAIAGYERPELLRWRLDQAEGDARRIALAALTPKGFTDRRGKPSEDEIDERLSILYYTIESVGDSTSGILPAEINADTKAGGNERRTEEQGERESPIQDPSSVDPVRLLVIDDVDAWFGQPGKMLSAAALTRVIQRLDELARSKRVAVVVLGRVQLSVEGRITARQLSRISHAASVVWTVAKNREKAEGGRQKAQASAQAMAEPESRRWLLPVKNNLAEEANVSGLAFELAEGRIRWRREPVPELAEALLPSVHNNDRRRLRRAACEWLEEALAGGPLPSGEVIKQALSCGISRGTLTRAISDLGIRSHKAGFNGGWEMSWTPQAPRRQRVFECSGGFRIVGAEAFAEDKRHAVMETTEQDEMARQASPLACPDAGDGDGCASSVASCASSEKHGDSSEVSCASSEKRGDFSAASCASSEKHGDSTEVSCGPSEHENWCEAVLQAFRETG